METISKPEVIIGEVKKEEILELYKDPTQNHEQYVSNSLIVLSQDKVNEPLTAEYQISKESTCTQTQHTQEENTYQYRTSNHAYQSYKRTHKSRISFHQSTLQ